MKFAIYILTFVVAVTFGYWFTLSLATTPEIKAETPAMWSVAK